MAEVTQHEPGMFNWVDLMTTDVESAKEFYSRILGCETVDNPVSDDFVYTLFSRNGKNIAGLSPMMPGMLEQGVPPHWNSYVAVANVEEAATKAAGLGGTVIMPPMDVMEFGRMTSILDPTGAVLNLWEAKAHIGADLIGEPGAFCWAELYTHDTGAAGNFYAGLFGWEAQEVPGAGGMPYNLFTSGGAPAAGMLAIQPIWGRGTPELDGLLRGGEPGRGAGTGAGDGRQHADTADVHTEHRKNQPHHRPPACLLDAHRVGAGSLIRVQVGAGEPVACLLRR